MCQGSCIVLYQDISLDRLLIPYAGMSKEELSRFSNRPFWVKFRCTLFFGVLSVWIYLISHALFSIVTANKTTIKDDWWKSGIVYEIYPRSFQDSNKDGIGDMKGILQRLDYFIYLGIQCIWITPFYKSPMKDFGYDISDFNSVDPLFGTLKDFEELVVAAHKQGIRIVLDFVPNHTSNEHAWFNESCQGIEPYRDYYVWKDGIPLDNGTVGPPNNWLSEFGGSAWTWNSHRNQYYYHSFLKEQPDLNYENPKVLEDMKDVLRFWLAKGVDGFRMDAVSHLHEDQQFLDEPVNDEDSTSASQDEFNYLKHTYVLHQPKTVETIGEFVKVIRQFHGNDGTSAKVVMVEDYDRPENLMAYFDVSKVDFPFNFDFVSAQDLKSLGGGFGTKRIIDNWMKLMRPNRSDSSTDYKNRWPNWVTSNHDRPRFATRFGENITDAFNTLILLLPGTPTVYYGDELGMSNIEVPPFTQTQDSYAINMGPERYKLYTRDPERSPMQWDNTTMAGFTEANYSWLPIHPDHEYINYEDEKSERFSHLNIFRALIALRKQSSFSDNIDIIYGPVTKNIISFVRRSNEGEKFPPNKGYFIVINMGRESEEYPLESHPYDLVPLDLSLKVVLTNGAIQTRIKSHLGGLRVGETFTFQKCKVSKLSTREMNALQTQFEEQGELTTTEPDSLTELPTTNSNIKVALDKHEDKNLTTSQQHEKGKEKHLSSNAVKDVKSILVLEPSDTIVFSWGNIIPSDII